MPITKQQVIQQLQHVLNPENSKDIVSLNMVKNVAVCEDYVSITIELPASSAPSKNKIQADIETAIKQIDPQIKQINVDFTAKTQPPNTPQQQAQQDNPLPNVKHIIAVGAGKGGVGKSTISTNLAVALARKGLKVGLLDGDIYGPSAPTMLGLHNESQTGSNDTLFPFNVAGIKVITIGKLVDPEKPLIWRGPMAHGAFNQLVKQTDWGNLDYLIVDLPPGTGDVPLSLAQLLPLSGAVIVCTPQRVAQDDARRAIGMFNQLDVTVLGVVENMSYFIGDDDKEYDIFGRGGAEQMANEMVLPMLGTIPINMELRKNCDNGEPLKNFKAGGKLAEELEAMANSLHQTITNMEKNQTTQTPTLNIS